jgi:hypothetical protein
MHERLTAHQSDAHSAKITNLPGPFFKVVEARMGSAIVVLRAIGAIEVALVGDVKAALERFTIEKTLTGLQNIIAGKFTAGLFKNLHGAWIRLVVYR